MRKDAQGHPIVDNLDQVDAYLKPRNKAVEKEKLFEFKDNVLQIDHVSTANVLAEFINSIPNGAMDKWMKQILIMRIGRPALNGKKMSHLAIALELGMRVEEVKELEKIAIKICNDYLERVTLVEGARGNDNKSLLESTMERVNKNRSE